MVTVARGRAAPLGSVIVPNIRPVVVCGNSGRQYSKTTMKPNGQTAFVGNRIRDLPITTRLWTGLGGRRQGVVWKPHRSGPTALPLIQSECQDISAKGIERQDT